MILSIFLTPQAAGKYRQQGRNYIVEDGDIIFFKFNAPNAPKKKWRKNNAFVCTTDCLVALYLATFTLFVFRAVGLNPPLVCQGTGSVNSDSFAI